MTIESPARDIFISYTGVDRHWAEWIGYVLEEQGLSVVIQAWDFRPGSNFALEMQRAAESASRTVMVLSPEYLKSEFAAPEWAAAFASDPQGIEHKLIPVMVRACAPTGMLKPLVHIDLTERDEPDAREELISGLRTVRAKPIARPTFPGSTQRSPASTFPGANSTAKAMAPVDDAELQARAGTLLPSARSSSGFSNGAVLTLVVVGGPKQRLIRPIEMDDPEFANSLRKAALFDETRVFDGSKGVASTVAGSVLTLREEHGGSIELQEDGSLRISANLGGAGRRHGVSAVIEEEVRHLITSGLTYAAWTLERVDPTARVTNLAVAASLNGAEHMPWMTQAEAAASNGSYSMGISMAQKTPECLSVTRDALLRARLHLVDDLLVPLRRQWPRATVRGF